MDKKLRAIIATDKEVPPYQTSHILAPGAVGPAPSPRGPLAPHLVRMNEFNGLDLDIDPP